jgi:hypothetical protein
MTDPNTVYVVSAYDKPHWRTLLSTKDKDAAEALKASIEADGVRAKIEAFPPARSSPSPKTPG